MSPLTLSRHRHRALVNGLDGDATRLAASHHFTVYGLPAGQAEADPDDHLVVHSLAPEQIDNNVGAYVADELLPLLAQVRHAVSVLPSPYASSEHENFQRYVGAIVRSIVDLGHNLGLRVVAEGVEDARSLAVLRDIGCDTAQGYLVSRPLPPDRLLTWLSTADVPVVPAPRRPAAV